jgi:cold shock CspA family protein
MRFEGVLSAWNQDAGYGTIRPSGGGEEVFVGLAAFPTDGEGPQPDEPLSFEIVTGRDGRKQAVNLRRMSHGVVSPALREAAGTGSARVRARQAQRKRRLGLAAGAVVAVTLLVGGVQWWHPLNKTDVPAGLRR